MFGFTYTERGVGAVKLEVGCLYFTFKVQLLFNIYFFVNTLVKEPEFISEYFDRAVGLCIMICNIEHS